MTPRHTARVVTGGTVMHTHRFVGNRHEKERVRAEIDAQIREFLEQGGEIEVIASSSRADARVVGGVWHAPLDIQLPAQRDGGTS